MDIDLGVGTGVFLGLAVGISVNLGLGMGIDLCLGEAAGARANRISNCSPEIFINCLYFFLLQLLNSFFVGHLYMMKFLYFSAK